MATAQANPDIDFFLLRLNKNIPPVVATCMAYVLPILSFSSTIFTIAIIILFRRQKDYIGVQRLVTCILILTSLGLIVRIPLSVILLGNNAMYTDYLEFKWCEAFSRANIDSPAVINIMLSLLKVGLAVQGLIMMFAPKKEKVLMTSRRTIWFCLLSCVTGVLVYIPAMYLLRFIPVPWVSKLDEKSERECCIPFPGDMVLSVEYYQRHVYLGRFVVTHVFPTVVMVTVGILLTLRLYIMKRVSHSDAVETYQKKEVIRAISVSMFAYTGLAIADFIALLILTLTYAQVNLGISIDNLNFLLSYLNMADTFCQSLMAPLTLAIFCCCDPRFRDTFMHVLCCKST